MPAAWRRLLRLPRRSRSQIAADVDAELGFHLAMREEELRARGVSADEASREARIRFGDVEEARLSLRRSEARAERTARTRMWMAAMRFDVAYALRRSLRESTFTATAVVTLALGTGATVALASVMQRMLMAPLPYPGADRLVMINQRSRDGSFRVTSPPELVAAFRAATPSLERVETVSGLRMATARDGLSQMIDVGVVSPGLLQYLQVPPALGRPFLPDEARTGAVPVLMLSWSTWQRRYQGSAAVLGTALTLGDRRYTIIGVMPRLFDPSVFGITARNEVWIPIHPEADRAFYTVLGALRKGASWTAMLGELDQAHARFREAGRMKDFLPQAVRLMDLAGSESRATLLLMAAAVALVLLIGCMNVANLLLARGAARDRELAIRAAIGASRSRLVRQLLTESVLLACMGGALGVAVARGLLALVAVTRPASFAALEDVRLDGRMLLFALALAGVTALVFGLGPAIVASRGQVGLLQRGQRRINPGRAGRQARRTLAFAEVACSVALVVAAMLLVRSASALQGMRLGYDIDPLVTMQVRLAEGAVSAAGVEPHLAPALERVRALPGVEHISVSENSPGRFGGCLCELLAEGAPIPSEAAQRFVAMWQIDTAWLATVGARLLKGRSPSADTSLRETLVTSVAADKLWPGRNPLGARFRMSREEALQTVVGVVELQRSPEGWLPGDSLQVATAKRYTVTEAAVTVRVTGDPEAAARPIARLIEDAAPTLRVYNAQTMRAVVADARAPQRFTRILLGGFAACALLLAAIGLYGVMSYGVTQRTREIGVRMALGAARASIGRLVLGEGLAITLGGVVAGCAGSLALNQLLARMLFGVTTRDVPAYAAAMATVVVVALLALWLPTRRALSINPVTAVSAE